MRAPVILLFGSFLLLSACQPSRPASVVGVWQGINDQGNLIRVEFSPDGHYHLFVDGTPLTCNPAGAPAITYKIIPRKRALKVNLFDESDKLLLGSLLAQFPTDDQLELQLLSTADASGAKDSLLLNRSEEGL